MTRDISKLMALNLRRPKLVTLEGRDQKSNNNEGEDDMGDEGGKIEIPATLQEYGVPIPEHNTQYKPLYLISLLESDSDSLIGKARQSSPINPEGSNASESDTPPGQKGHLQDSNPQSHDSNPTLQPITSPSAPTHGTLIFTSSNESAQRLSRLLALLRPSWPLGTLTKSTSGQNPLSLFRKRKLSILIASDRASRGLDIPDLAHVVNYDMPKSGTSYVHRVGRTARAGKEGRATTLVEHSQGKWFWRDGGGIAGSEVVRRGKGRKVVRRNLAVDLGGEGRGVYEDALRRLGEEAKKR